MSDNFFPNCGICQSPAAALSALPYLNAMEALSQTEPLIIENPLVFLVNPVARGGAAKISDQVHKEIHRMTASGELQLLGGVTIVETLEDPAARASAIVKAVSSSNLKRVPIVVVFGGDGTVATVMEALIKGKNGSPLPYLIPGPGGTAGDLKRNAGFSNSPSTFIEQVAKAQPAELDIVTVKINGGEPRLLLHSQTNGASGVMFKAVHERFARLRSAGKMSPIHGILAYMREVPPAFFSMQPFQANAFLDGAKVLIEAPALCEVVGTANTTSMAGIGRLPQPMEGARVHFIPIDTRIPGYARLWPPAAVMSEAFINFLRYTLGDQTVVTPGKKLLSAPSIDIPPGSTLKIEFTNMEGGPNNIFGALNGDPLDRRISTLEITTTTAKVPTLAVEGSALFIQRAMAVPRNMLDATVRMFNKGLRIFNSYGILASIAGYEVYKDTSGMDDKQRQIADMGFTSIIFGFDIFSAFRYGTQLILGEIPLMIPFYEAGYQTASAAAALAAEKTGIEELEQGHIANTLASIGAGFAATYSAIKLIGPQVWKASAAQINKFVINGSITAIESAGGFFSTAFRLIMSRFPIFIFPGVIRSIEDSSEESTFS